MGYSGPGKISGHSGTEHKHRRAFEKIKSYKGNNSSKSGEFILPIVSSEPTNYQQAYKQDRKFKLFFKLPVFIISVILISFVFVNSFGNYQNALITKEQKSMTDLKSVQKTKTLEAYTLLVNSGYYYLRTNQLSNAQSDFIYALSLDKYGKDARIGLTVTMLKRCQQYHEVCDQVQINIDFLSEMKYLKENKIKELEEQLDIAYLE